MYCISMVEKPGELDSGYFCCVGAYALWPHWQRSVPPGEKGALLLSQILKAFSSLAKQGEISAVEDMFERRSPGTLAPREQASSADCR